MYKVIIQIIGMLILCALGAEVAKGVITGGTMGNSTIELICGGPGQDGIVMTIVQGIVDLLISIPKLIMNFVISLLNGLLGLSIPHIP